MFGTIEHIARGLVDGDSAAPEARVGALAKMKFSSPLVNANL